ncbi:hypothetical protein BBOV_III004300 [Babesia bovis T2Bo]|uniref:Uncharacterized protein n=1 Tax=Babesia bovis TaxID=5865 RepID=A7AN59_BABBO|nr:hypothetical protein BBOV_III004300 [Babesia bovis T2Bo]EDO07993.1 hypothetical protein BBOV_III004300 [Babesia bovis T2Bo]|eukprot:XP_001611561.1 hypothetical protein [Babesia bovis T2Bo]
MAQESQDLGSDYDIKECELPADSVFLGHGGSGYFFCSGKSYLAFSDHLELLSKVDLKHRCLVGYRFDRTLALAASNSLYLIDPSGTLSERKFKKRLIHVHLLDESTLLLVVICRNRKALQVVLGEHDLRLESYKGQCQSDIIFAAFVDDFVFCLAYVHDNSEVKIALIAINDGRPTLIRHQCFRQAKKASMSRAIGSSNAFMLECDGDRSVLRYDYLHKAMVLVRHFKFSPSKEAVLCLMDEDHVVQFMAGKAGLHVTCDGIFTEAHSEWLMPYGEKHGSVLSVTATNREVSVLIRAGDTKAVIVQFTLGERPLEIFVGNKSMLKKSQDELRELIQQGKIPINSELVDHIMRKKMRSCAVECLQSVYIPESQAISLVMKDMSLLSVFIEHTRGDQNGLVKAIRNQLPVEMCGEIIERLLQMLDDIGSVGTQQLHCYKRVVAFLNIFMDAMLFEMHEAKLLKQEWIDRLQGLVKHCNTENHNLQSLLSFTNSLLKKRNVKEDGDNSSLIVVQPITV